MNLSLHLTSVDEVTGTHRRLANGKPYAVLHLGHDVDVYANVPHLVALRDACDRALAELAEASEPVGECELCQVRTDDLVPERVESSGLAPTVLLLCPTCSSLASEETYLLAEDERPSDHATDLADHGSYDDVLEPLDAVVAESIQRGRAALCASPVPSWSQITDRLS